MSREIPTQLDTTDGDDVVGRAVARPGLVLVAVGGHPADAGVAVPPEGVTLERRAEGPLSDAEISRNTPPSRATAFASPIIRAGTAPSSTVSVSKAIPPNLAERLLFGARRVLGRGRGRRRVRGRSRVGREVEVVSLATA